MSAGREQISVFLIRHGQKQNGPSLGANLYDPICLTKLGISQIEKLASHLADREPQLLNHDVIYSSPIPRTIQTAEILRSRLNISVIVGDPIFEEIAISGATPVPESDQKRILRESLENIDHLPPNGISVRSRLLKICSFIEERHKAKDKILLVSTHGVLINNLVYYLFPDLKPPKEKLLEPKTSPGSLTLLRLNNRQYNLDCFGYTTS